MIIIFSSSNCSGIFFFSSLLDCTCKNCLWLLKKSSSWFAFPLNTGCAVVWTSCLHWGSDLAHGSEPAGERGTAEWAQNSYHTVIGLMKQKGENGGLLASRSFHEEVRETRIPLMAGFLANDFSTTWTELFLPLFWHRTPEQKEREVKSQEQIDIFHGKPSIFIPVWKVTVVHHAFFFYVKKMKPLPPRRDGLFPFGTLCYYP